MTALSTYQRATAFMVGAVTIEVAFNAVHQILNGNLKAQGKTQLWVYPLYFFGSVHVFEPLRKSLRGYPAPVRALAYATMFLGLEYLGGKVALKITGRCPWEYKNAAYASPDKIVNFAYGPLWAAYGLVAEQAHNFFLRLQLQPT